MSTWPSGPPPTTQLGPGSTDRGLRSEGTVASIAMRASTAARAWPMWKVAVRGSISAASTWVRPSSTKNSSATGACSGLSRQLSSRSSMLRVASEERTSSSWAC